ncbi:hypothetical protein QYF36_011353 [Acer negundo]|nr:hypothetical protein QYF36_011353 [Acer negundo]
MTCILRGTFFRRSLISLAGNAIIGGGRGCDLVNGKDIEVGGGGGCDLVDGEDLEVSGGRDGPTNGIANMTCILRGTFFRRSLISLAGNAIIGTIASNLTSNNNSSTTWWCSYEIIERVCEVLQLGKLENGD